MKHSGYISLYLDNMSEWEIAIVATITMTGLDEKWTFGPHETIEPYRSLGYGKFLSHNRIRHVKGDENLQISITISHVLKDFQDGLRPDHLTQSMGIKEIRQSVRMLPRMQSDIAKLTEQMKALETAVSNSGAGKGSNSWKDLGKEERNSMIPKPECPVCFEAMTPSTKIAQCITGHIVCWSCKARIEVCPSCKLSICGRAFGMENYIKILFG